MTLQQYEDKFSAQLIDNWRGGSWKEYVRQCYAEYMDSVDEQKIADWENNNDRCIFNNGFNTFGQQPRLQ